MGFNNYTLLVFPLGLLIPAVVIAFFAFSKHKKESAYDAIAYGAVSFLASMVAVFLAFIITNALFLSNLTFSDDTSGLTIAGVVFSFMIAVMFVVCESLKLSVINKFKSSEKRTKFSALAYSAGVIIAQNAVVFVALNIFNNYDMTAGFALFSGAALLVTGIMYTALSLASEVALVLNSKGAAYGVSAVYYLFLISAIICVRSSVLLYIVTAFFFVISLVLSGVFIKKKAGKK